MPPGSRRERWASWLASHEPIEGTPLSRRSAFGLAFVLYAGVFGPGIYAAVSYGFGSGDTSATTLSAAHVAVTVVCQAVVALVAALAIIRGLAGSWRPVLGRGMTAWRIEVVAGSWCVCLMTVSGIVMAFLPGHGFPAASGTAGHVGDVISFVRTGPVEEICALVAPLVILRAGRVPWPTVFVVLVLMRVLYHLYYGPAAIALSLWALGTAVVYLWARSIVGIMIAHSLFDLTAFPLELGHPGLAALLHWSFVLVCLVIGVRALRRLRRRRREQHADTTEGEQTHSLVFPDEQHARTAAAVLVAAGWVPESIRPVAGAGTQWIVSTRQSAGGHDREDDARAFFEGVAATNGPGRYRGRSTGD